MQPFIGKVVKSGTEFCIKVPADRVQEFPAKESFSVRIYNPEPPYTTYVPTMETRLRRFGKESGLTIPRPLIASFVLKHRAIVAVLLVPHKL